MSTIEGKLAVMGGAAKINGMIAFFLCQVKFQVLSRFPGPRSSLEFGTIKCF